MKLYKKFCKPKRQAEQKIYPPKIVHSHPFHLVHPKTETKAISIDHRERRFIINFPLFPNCEERPLSMFNSAQNRPDRPN